MDVEFLIFKEFISSPSCPLPLTCSTLKTARGIISCGLSSSCDFGTLPFPLTIMLEGISSFPSWAWAKNFPSASSPSQSDTRITCSGRSWSYSGDCGSFERLWRTTNEPNAPSARWNPKKWKIFSLCQTYFRYSHTVFFTRMRMIIVSSRIVSNKIVLKSRSWWNWTLRN